MLTEAQERRPGGPPVGAGDQQGHDHVEHEQRTVDRTEQLDPELAGVGDFDLVFLATDVRTATNATANPRGTPVFAYYPDKQWLSSSKFVHAN